MTNNFNELVRARTKLDIKPKKRPKRNVYPLRVEKAYAIELTRLMNKLNKKIRGHVADRYVRIKNKYQKETKVDAFDDDLERLMELIGIEVLRTLSTANLIRLATRYGIDTSIANIQALEAQFLSVTRVIVIPKEAYLASKISTFASQNASLITNIGVQTSERVKNIIYSAVSTGERYEVVAKELTKAFGFSKNRAKLIARDQIGSLNSSLSFIRLTNAGIKKFEWATALDNRVRPTHSALNGKIFKFSKPPAEGLPGQPIQCRCIALPVFEDET